MIDSYMNRKRWEAQVQAVALMETWAQTMPKSNKRGKTTVDEFLKIAGA